MASNETINSDDTPKEMKDRRKWYSDAANYWKEIPPTLNGMLGGYAHISRADIIDSKRFLSSVLELSHTRSLLSQKPSKIMPIETSAITDSLSTNKVKPCIALDCGAGIGRITKNLLLPLFDVVDMVEQNAGFLEKAREYLGEKIDRIGHFYAKGLQDFTPQAGRYSMIWCQWVLGHLTDEDFVAFLKRCQLGLVPRGLICVKENITRGGVHVDSNDSSVTRSDEKLKDLFAEASLVVIKDEIQKNFPGELYRVKMYALRPGL